MLIVRSTLDIDSKNGGRRRRRRRQNQSTTRSDSPTHSLLHRHQSSPSDNNPLHQMEEPLFLPLRPAALAGVSLKNRQSARAFSHRFSLFVSHYLSRRDASSAIRNFHLSFDSYQLDVDAEFVEKCVSYAIDHGVESLHLRAFCHQTLRLPAAFYSCKSLRELKLTHFSHHGIYLPKGLSFPNLKTLYLEESAFLYDDVHGYSYRNEPFSGFPELEKLILRQSIQVDRLVISAPKLRFLEIIHDRLYSQVIQEISAPLPP